MPRHLPAIPPIPHDLYSEIYILGSFSFTVRQQQVESKERLFKLLHSQEPGAIHELPEALREHARAFIHDRNGAVIHGENWTNATALHLAAQVEGHIRNQLHALGLPAA